MGDGIITGGGAHSSCPAAGRSMYGSRLEQPGVALTLRDNLRLRALLAAWCQASRAGLQRTTFAGST
jgi:hypothetical protein